MYDIYYISYIIRSYLAVLLNTHGLFTKQFNFGGFYAVRKNILWYCLEMSSGIVHTGRECKSVSDSGKIFREGLSTTGNSEGLQLASLPAPRSKCLWAVTEGSCLFLPYRQELCCKSLLWKYSVDEGLDHVTDCLVKSESPKECRNLGTPDLCLAGSALLDRVLMRAIVMEKH